jgi:hypothetical protein
LLRIIKNNPPAENCGKSFLANLEKILSDSNNLHNNNNNNNNLVRT